MNEAIEVLTKLRDDYEQRIEALNEAIELLKSNQIRPEEALNPVFKNPPVDFSVIRDYNPGKGGIRKD